MRTGTASSGTSRPTPAVAAITVAEHLQGDRIAVVVRLSNGAGSPYAADLQSARHGVTLGLGIEFALPSGGRATWGAPNMTAFPASTPQEFVEVTTAQRRNARGHRNLLRLLAFVLRHRRAVPGLKALISHPPVRSFAAADFHGLHAYYLVDADGRRQAFRYRWISTMTGPRNLTERGGRAVAAPVPRRGDVPAGGAWPGDLGAEPPSWPRTATRPTIRHAPGRRRARRSMPAR